jgi:hypothetical protein
MKTTESVTKKYVINKNLVVTVKSDPIEQDGMVETWKNTITVKSVIEKLNPIEFEKGEAIKEYIDTLKFEDPQMSLLDQDDDRTE